MTLLKRYIPNLYLSLLSHFFLSVILPNLAIAQGDLQIMPRRVVFEGTKRFQELNLANTGQDSAQYVVSFVNYKMTASGEFKQITDPEEGQNFADKFLRVFPRTVSLAPNESQTVKIQIIKASNLLTGEYRSYLQFRAVPKLKPLGEKDPKADSLKAFSVKLTPVFGLSIPVIIRLGETNVKVSLSDCRYENNENDPKLRLTFNRTGNISAYGHLTVKHVAPDGTSNTVGLTKGVAVYTPNLKRDFVLDLASNKDIDYRKGKLLITYASPEEDGKIINLAESEISLK
jgi:P pilus assembly chaperone PapD